MQTTTRKPPTASQMRALFTFGLRALASHASKAAPRTAPGAAGRREVVRNATEVMGLEEMCEFTAAWLARRPEDGRKAAR